jgi:hypothetical protein
MLYVRDWAVYGFETETNSRTQRWRLKLPFTEISTTPM